jgi:D-alanyl-D-alanine dipeptidase
MGSSWDLFHEASNHDSPLITNPIHINNRQILREAMKNAGFRETPNEWWHYTLEPEPFPETYFDFVLKT